MFDSEDEIITLGIYRFPWLIWIQLLVTFLLILILLYYFILFGSSDDLSNSTTNATPNIIASSSLSDRFSFIRYNTNAFLHHHPKVGKSRSVRGETGTSSGLRIVRSTSDIGQNEDTVSTNFEVSENSHHPCHFFGLAKHAFLKCFGLDFTSESHSSRKRKKEE